ncbi:MAG TPA: alpha-glucan family phosphorylase [Anaeromyxobacteraceae bacterium]|nr:alpha-glucan family phosphorylase [Anaeromyxobacteraceae bacterium]
MADQEWARARPLPSGLEVLSELALDLRWTWSHGGDAVWRAVDPDAWERTQNPWVMLQGTADARLEALSRDPAFRAELARLVADRERDRGARTWFARQHGGAALGAIAYFSMEFGLGAALPLYAGGLGILAGDFLKGGSDLGVPLVGVGLLYQEGYFHQMIDGEGRQQETYPYNDPGSLPLRPARRPDGSWLRVSLALPGRELSLRVWLATVGAVPLLLLDTNDPRNGPFDRGIAAKLYGDGPETRLLQEIVLGVGGWRALRAMGFDPDVCHLNEGHAAFAPLARAAEVAERLGVGFDEALWATRAGNVFTTHTPVAAGFDAFAPPLVHKYFRGPLLGAVAPGPERLLALGRRDTSRAAEPLSMAHLAMRTCGLANGVSHLHGEVSRGIFKDLYPGWPIAEVPVGHVTNGVHVPSWDSRAADGLWTEACGKERWLGAPEGLARAIEAVPDAELWTFRGTGRQELVRYARSRLATQFGQRGADPEEVARARHVLDPNALTLGFARRFAAYKRPNLLLADPARLSRLLSLPGRPVQIVVAGKAHPADEEGKRLLEAWVAFVREPSMRTRAVVLEDYDIAIAQKLVEGVDVWINTPRRPFEACGTSGMKLLVNGGLNLSERDGWWAEAFEPGVGWAIGDGAEHADPGWDRAEAGELYRILEEEVVPAFYDRDSLGVPRGFVARMRASMARLTPRFSTNRMLGEYLERLYLPAAEGYRRRVAGGAALARELAAWSAAMAESWQEVRFGEVRVADGEGGLRVEAQVLGGGIPADRLRVELYAEPLRAGEAPVRVPMEWGEEIPGAVNGRICRASAPPGRPASHYTPRIVPFHPEVRVPMEEAHVAWYARRDG